MALTSRKDELPVPERLFGREGITLRHVRELVKFFNAFARARFQPGKGYGIVFGEHGIVFEVPPEATVTKAVTAQTSHPWKPYSSSAGKFRLIPGTVDNRLPGNWNAELPIQANATGYWVYLSVMMSQTGVASGCTITQGANVPATGLPGSDGAIPATFYVPLFAYDSGADAIARVYQAKKENLRTSVTVQESCDGLIRSAVIIA